MRFETVLIFVFLLIKTNSVDAPNNEPCENNLICQKSHNASAGEDVTLDCHTKPQRDVSDESVTWEFGHEIVLLYRNKDVDPGAQAERFKRRADKDITWNPAKGKLAVKIKSVKTTDAGVYTCSVGVEKDKVSCTTKLIFKQTGDSDNQMGKKSKEPPTTPSHSQTNIGDPVITLVLATFALLYLLCH